MYQGNSELRRNFKGTQKRKEQKTIQKYLNLPCRDTDLFLSQRSDPSFQQAVGVEPWVGCLPCLGYGIPLRGPEAWQGGSCGHWDSSGGLDPNSACSSLPGTPAELQGVWNEKLEAQGFPRLLPSNCSGKWSLVTEIQFQPGVWKAGKALLLHLDLSLSYSPVSVFGGSMY